MCEVDEQLKQLLEKAMGENPNSQTYKLLFQQIMFQMQQSGQILKCRRDVDIDSYQNALLKTWEWLRKKLREYDSNIGSIYSWFNQILSFRIKDEQIRRFNLQNSIEHPFVDRKKGEWINRIDSIEDRQEKSELSEYVEAFLDSHQERLESQFPNNCPQGNCYDLLKNRLPLGEKKTWKELAEELESNPKTLHSHYQKKCLKFLKNWLIQQGYKP